ncbi:cation:proton antiporter [Deinococcus sp. YIM 134068]|uniref:cation:proton antiporter domain-containing protein n=1 Tax=Deinococcus lichenicola TaxID=3118910 RepID=UPI002F92137E
MSSLASPGVTLALLTVAVVGKVGGTLLGARATGVEGRTAWQLGVLLNTRGLTELVFLAAGLHLGVIQPPLYTSLVVVAPVTTLAIGPLLDAVGGGVRRLLLPAGETILPE